MTTMSWRVGTLDIVYVTFSLVYDILQFNFIIDIIDPIGYGMVSGAK